MSQLVDARSLACPQPVVLTSKALAVADQVTVLVDNAVAAENVTRLARSKGFSVEKTVQGDTIRLQLARDGQAPVSPEEPCLSCGPAPPSAGPLVIFVPSNCLGRGADELGERLLGAFFHTLLELPPRPQTIVFMNAGVKLTVAGSRALEDLRTLESQGVELLVCGTCLGYFQLTEQLAVGRVSNMYDIAKTLLEAGKLVEL